MIAISSSLVVGGGIVGLVTARALALKGIKVTLLERKATITDEGGIGIGMQSNALNALGEIGLAQACVDKGVPVDTISLFAPDGSLVMSRAPERHCNSPWPGFTGISRAALHSFLVDGARDAGVDLVVDAEVASVQQQASTATAVLADGRSFSADLIVGADGIHSRVRAAVFPNQADPVSLGEGVWRGLIEGVQRHDVSMMFGGPVGTVGYTPLQGDIYLYVVDQDSNAPARDEPDVAARLIDRIGKVPGFPALLLPHLSRRPGDVTYRPLASVWLPAPWHAGRIVIIGDAAHAGPPTLAQGAAMGIEDGVVLARCLAEATSLSAGLDAFMKRRYDRVKTIVDASITISRAQMERGGQARMAEANKAAANTLAQPY